MTDTGCRNLVDQRITASFSNDGGHGLRQSLPSGDAGNVTGDVFDVEVSDAIGRASAMLRPVASTLAIARDQMIR